MLMPITVLASDGKSKDLAYLINKIVKLKKLRGLDI